MNARAMTNSVSVVLGVIDPMLCVVVDAVSLLVVLVPDSIADTSMPDASMLIAKSATLPEAALAVYVCAAVAEVTSAARAVTYAFGRPPAQAAVSRAA